VEMWKSFILMAVCSVVSIQATAREHVLVATNMCQPSVSYSQRERTMTFTVGGSHVTQVAGKQWQFHNEDGATEPAGLSFATVGNAQTTVSITTPDSDYDTFVFKVFYGSGTAPANDDVVEVVRVQNPVDLPLYKMADDVVRTLNGEIYRHTFYTYNFERFDNFYPNVGKYFRRRRDEITERRDQIAQYILKKQATISQLPSHANAYAPDYECALMRKGGFNKVIKVTAAGSDEEMKGKLDIQKAYKAARTHEVETVKKITEIINKADDQGDGELSEFLGAEIIPGLTKSVKRLTNDIQQLTKLSTSALGSFIFDRTNY